MHFGTTSQREEAPASAGCALREGGKDPWFETTIDKIIIEDPGRYAVWLVRNKLTKADDVWWWSRDDLSTEACDVVVRVAELEAINTYELRTQLRDSYSCLLGSAISGVFVGTAVGANRTLDYAHSFVRARLEEAARSWYLSTSVVGIILTSIAMGIVFATCWTRAAGCSDVWRLPMYSIGMGVVGSAVSLISRAGTFSVDPAAGRGLHVLEAIGRLVVGAVAGFVTCLGLRARLVMPELMASTGMAPMLVAFGAGYSERFIASVADTLGKSGVAPAPAAQASTPATDQTAGKKPTSA